MHHGTINSQQSRTLQPSRTQVSSDQSDRLQNLSTPSLEREIHSVILILKHFAQSVSDRNNDPFKLNSFLRELDLRLITRDHNWRSVFAELQRQDGSSPTYKNGLISEYLKYLSSRQKLVSYIFDNRKALSDTGDHADKQQAAAKSLTGYARLPKGVPVMVMIPYREELVIHLGHHQFRIVDGCPPRLLDPANRVMSLSRGRQVVGRHPKCDKVTNNIYPNVSRCHLHIEWHGDSRLQITDRSSQGTFVNPDCIENTDFSRMSTRVASHENPNRNR